MAAGPAGSAAVIHHGLVQTPVREGAARLNRPSRNTGEGAGKGEEGEESPPPLKARGQGLSAWLPLLVSGCLESHA